MKLLPTLAMAALVAPLLAQSSSGCKESASLGTFRFLVRHSAGGAALPIKQVSGPPAGSHLVWEPIHLYQKDAKNAEVTAILVPESGEDLVVLEPRKANATAEWRIPAKPAAIAVVFGPQGLSMGKVKSLVTHNRQLVERIADYAEQSSKVETLVQELSDAEKSGGGVDAALTGFSTRYGVALPKLDGKASSDQQAAVLLKTLLPSAGSYDPLGARSAQMQQSVGLAASIAGLFFGNAVGLAAGGTALFQGIHGAFFPSAEFRSAFAQNDERDGLALCTKGQGQKARTRLAYLWAYRVPNLKAPVVSLSGPAYLPAGRSSTIGVTAANGTGIKHLDRARDWHLVPVGHGTAEAVPVRVTSTLDGIELDLGRTKAKPGDYKLAAVWDWDLLDVTGTVHLRPLADYGRAQLTPASRDKLIEGSGVVQVTLTGADFEFLEKVEVAKAAKRPLPPTAAHFVLPRGKRAGEQTTVEVDLDTSARGLYSLLLTQSGGTTREVPFTVHPPNPVLSGLPLRVNLGETKQPLRFEGTGLDRIESISSEAGEIEGLAGPSMWSGTIRLNPQVRLADVFAVSVKVKGLESPLVLPAAIKVFGTRPSITEVKKSLPAAPGVSIRPEELPLGTTVGLVLAFRRFQDPAANGAEVRPRVELGCKSGSERKRVRLSPDDHVPGTELSLAAPGMLFLSLDPGTVGYAGCVLTATVEVEPEGRSNPFTIGQVVRLPRLDQFTLTNEQTGPSTYVGILTGRDLDVIAKTGWDLRDGIHVDGVPTPVPGDPSVQTIRIALPWPAPAPHAPLFLWLRGEAEGRKTTVTY